MFLSKNYHKFLLKKWLSLNYPLRLSSSVDHQETHKKTDGNSHKYTDTILLPKSNFPMKHSRKLELKIAQDSDFGNFYEKQLERSTNKRYYIHDGPPYANGPAHIGHAINKILKDVILRRKVLEKYKVNYVPGWDCHGLPIELKAVTDNQTSHYSQTQLRHTARQFALQAVGQQRQSFMNWGVKGDWNNSYLTIKQDYIENELKIFYKLYEKGLILRDSMPVYWSTSSQTALAEAELLYNHEHISTAVYVKMRVTYVPDSLRRYSDNLYAIIWTTTPWTLPSDQFIAYSQNDIYTIVEIEKYNTNKQKFVLARQVIAQLERVLGSRIHILHSFDGCELSQFSYLNPIDPTNRPLSFVHASYVSMTKGTGLVHSAPNHGLEDYKLALKNNITLIDNLVDKHGRFNSKSIPELVGKDVLTDGNETVIKMLGDYVVHVEKYQHSYPYDWRTNKPTITLPSQQWFINMDMLRHDCIKALDSVKFWPDFGKKDLISQLLNRPHWCISRQRLWGVPIPVFYMKHDVNKSNPIINQQIFNDVLACFRNRGVDSWWQLSVDQVLTSESVKSLNGLTLSDLQFGTDIFDIWFDSGVSWSYVLDGDKVADVYVEGIDQIRGWFQSSLVTSVAVRNKPPYKNVVIHGFALDKERRKMSKSLGNVIDPNHIIDGNKSLNVSSYGADTLRWCLMMNGSGHENCSLSNDSFDLSLQHVNKLRNTTRFMIGSLGHFDTSDCVNVGQMVALDRYVLHLLNKYYQNVNYCYHNFQLDTLVKESLSFIYNTVSSFYFSRIKDRLYCEQQFSLERRSCLTVLHYLYNIIIYSLYPIVPHIMHEAQLHLKSNPIDQIDNKINLWKNDDLEEKMKLAMAINETINNEFIYGKNIVEYDLYINLLKNNYNYDLNDLRENYHEMFLTSSVIICNEKLPDIDGTILKGFIEKQQVNDEQESNDSSSDQLAEPDEIIKNINKINNDYDYEILITPARNYLCERCRRYISHQNDSLCKRCERVMSR